MALWISISLIVLAVVGLALAIALRPAAQRKREERRRRYALKETSERVPLASDWLPAEPGRGIEELPLVGPAARAPDIRRAPTLLEALREGDIRPYEPEPTAPTPVPVQGRMVHTPEGEMILTTPPFSLRQAILGRRSARYFHRLNLRVPAWVVCCPKVRLDALLSPTTPDGREAADWAAWRRRVRWRSLDLVLADRRTWRPLVAIVFEQSQHVPVARDIAGGHDRIVDEVLHAVGLPLLRLSGDFAADWPLIQPYVEEAILPSADEERSNADVRAEAIGPQAAVNLLRLDQDKGWILG